MLQVFSTRPCTETKSSASVPWTVPESVRRAILKNPKLAPSFYQLALLDGLSFDAKTNMYGPDGSVMKIVLSSKDTDEYTKNLQEAAFALVAAEKALKMKTAVTIADAVAIGVEVESIGGPVLTVQLGRADAGRSSGTCQSTFRAIDRRPKWQPRV
jgi:hypothetical protein